MFLQHVWCQVGFFRASHSHHSAFCWVEFHSPSSLPSLKFVQVLLKSVTVCPVVDLCVYYTAVCEKANFGMELLWQVVYNDEEARGLWHSTHHGVLYDVSPSKTTAFLHLIGQEGFDPGVGSALDSIMVELFQ